MPLIVGTTVPTTVAVIAAVTGACCFLAAALKRKVRKPFESIYLFEHNYLEYRLAFTVDSE